LIIYLNFFSFLGEALYLSGEVFSDYVVFYKYGKLNVLYLIKSFALI